MFKGLRSFSWYCFFLTYFSPQGTNIVFFLASPPEGAGDIRDPLVNDVRAIIWRQPVALQLWVAVAAASKPRGRPGDLRLATASVRTLLLVHPRGGVPVRATAHHQILPRHAGAGGPACGAQVDDDPVRSQWKPTAATVTLCSRCSMLTCQSSLPECVCGGWFIMCALIGRIGWSRQSVPESQNQFDARWSCLKPPTSHTPQYGAVFLLFISSNK